ncbi:MAG: NapC/NirT family cytochrome c [candidate division Zixibacteria bacterium]|nr:NapC/NirT family cytochrome c [candidate division Zixibacteria bacterium]
MERPKFPRLAQNSLSTAGAIVALVTGLIMIVMLGISLTGVETNAYFGIFVFMVLPVFLVLGLLLIPLGMFRQWRRWQRSGREEMPEWPLIDLNRTGHRNATIIFLVGTILFIGIGAVGSYQAYHFTESVTFCGTTCHEVMEPEHTAYLQSPHARVACAECHVGYGAGWYAKSKLSGAYQVYATLANKYPQPIPTPITSLRPAQETCERCHWPEKRYGAQQRQSFHYEYDESSTPWAINMLVRVGGGNPILGHTAGIHWHMNVGVDIEYIARDERRQDIPWIRAVDRNTGRVTVYQNEKKLLTEEEINSTPKRRMDCVDCHNRPSHIFHSPDHAIDEAITLQKIDRSLPDIKRIAVEAMAKEYDTKAAASAGIAGTIADYYKLKDAAFYHANEVQITKAIGATQEAFSKNIFPWMKAKWSGYPDNIGHFINPGCMRCHDGKHKSADGVTITRECNTCHSILSQGRPDSLQMSTSEGGLEFVHPVDISDAWRETGCYECHQGVQP